jgi:hypothetical protein
MAAGFISNRVSVLVNYQQPLFVVQLAFKVNTKLVSIDGCACALINNVKRAHFDQHSMGINESTENGIEQSFANVYISLAMTSSEKSSHRPSWHICCIDY